MELFSQRNVRVISMVIVGVIIVAGLVVYTYHSPSSSPTSSSSIFSSSSTLSTLPTSSSELNSFLEQQLSSLSQEVSSLNQQVSSLNQQVSVLQSGQCSFYVFTNESYYYAQNCVTGVITYGGPNDAGGVSGTSAASVINNAIAALPTSGLAQGGIIQFGVGEFVIGSSVSVGNDVTLEGAGRNSTIFVPSSSLDAPVITDSGGIAGSRGVTLENFGIVGDGYNTNPGTYGILWYALQAGSRDQMSFIFQGLYVDMNSGDALSLPRTFPVTDGFGVVEDSSFEEGPNGHTALSLILSDSQIIDVYTKDDSSHYPEVYAGGGTNVFTADYFGGSSYTRGAVEVQGAATFSNTIIDFADGACLNLDIGTSIYDANFTFTGGQITDCGAGAMNTYPSILVSAADGATFNGVKFYNYNPNIPSYLIQTVGASGVVNDILVTNCQIQVNTFAAGIANITPGSVTFANNEGYP